ncbi:CBS domain-containing protein [Scytonema sp. UIC 10036]|uniref:CBS domain-containing protein n=1 Tax=Scytonema sp. UIC 10036 TaxID=2304196 RepID=UPI001A9A986E|nr:CBS domain-containing protein [Scytonema sp. UIC 10036]
MKGSDSSKNSSLKTSSIASPVEVSCVLVMANSQLKGIFTEQDLVKLMSQKKSLEGISVAEVMTQQLLTLRVGELKNVFTILNLLLQHSIRHVPILDDVGKLLGIVTPTSLLQVLNSIEADGVVEQLQNEIAQLKAEKAELLLNCTKLEQQLQQVVAEHEKVKTELQLERKSRKTIIDGRPVTLAVKAKGCTASRRADYGCQ